MRPLAALLCVALAAGCGNPRGASVESSAPRGPVAAPGSDGTSSDAVGGVADGGAPPSDPLAPGEAERAWAPGALLDVWEVEGSLAQGCEPLAFERPSSRSVWLASGRAPEVLGGSAWIARVSAVLRVDAAGPRQLELALSCGARVTLDGEVKLDEFASSRGGARVVALGELAAGEHPFELWTWGNAQDRELALSWREHEALAWRWLAPDDWAHERTALRGEPGPRRVKRPLARRNPPPPAPELDPAMGIETIPLEAPPLAVAGLAGLGPGRWLVAEPGARAAVALLETADETPARSRTFASGLDHPGGIAIGDGRVFVLQRCELTELVDRDGDGSADEYRVALELPGRDFARPLGLALDQGLAAALFETESGARALVASLADGRTTPHDLRDARQALVAPGFAGSFLVVGLAADSASARLHWIGMHGERSWSSPVAAKRWSALARESEGQGLARFLLSTDGGELARLEVRATAAGFDVSTIPLGRSSLSQVAAAAAVDGRIAFLAGTPPSLARVLARPEFVTLLGARGFRDGVELEFSRPLAPDQGWEREAWLVGEGDVEPSPPDWVSISEDRRRVALGCESRVPDRARARCAPECPDPANRFWELGLSRVRTQVGAQEPGVERGPMPTGVRNVLSDAERAAGWRLLFDGTSTAGWRNYGKPDAATGWAAEGGELVRVAEGGGDLVTEELFESFELEFDWRLWPGGNSGVFFHVADGYDTVWRTGPEFQLLDNAGHADGRDPLTSAGANYALHAPEYDDTRPITTWNHARLVVDGARVEHWLNGAKQCEYELWSEDWRTRVAGSKFAAMPDYGKSPTGRIALQDHGDRVAFKNLKIRPISR